MSSPDFPDSALPPSSFRSVWRPAGPLRVAVALGALGRVWLAGGGFLGPGARRGLLFGRGVALVPAIPIVNEDNPDLQIFEPVLVIVAMLWLLFLLYGLAVGWVASAFP